jgi:hypothetical protein
VAEQIGVALNTVRVRLIGIARIGFVVFAAGMMSVMVTGEAAAKHRRHVAHHHGLSKQTVNAQAAMLPQSASSGSMRYYGGPKSPMWRQ